MEPPTSWPHTGYTVTAEAFPPLLPQPGKDREITTFTQRLGESSLLSLFYGTDTKTFDLFRFVILFSIAHVKELEFFLMIQHYHHVQPLTVFYCMV